MAAKRSTIRRGAAAVLLALALLAPSAGSALAGVDLPVPRRTIHPGDEIAPSLLMERRFPDATVQRFAVIVSAGELTGMQARRTLLPGQPIPLNAVAAPQLVKRGQPTRLVFHEGGLVIVAQVEALQSAGAGEVVKVRNIDSGVTVVGTVQSDGTVLVGNQ